ncbi:MAG: type II toxin-antitoxin system HicA family toxin [Magnetococcales bacterium]|nr:type II toxin-antitoxin system HicA family toxin [Magnetococcales bacterium]
MRKIDKILVLAKRNSDGVSFRDFETLLNGLGFRLDRQSGSHMIFIAPKGQRISVQNRDGMAKGYQVRQALKLIEE